MDKKGKDCFFNNSNNTVSNLFNDDTKTLKSDTCNQQPEGSLVQNIDNSKGQSVNENLCSDIASTSVNNETVHGVLKFNVYGQLQPEDDRNITDDFRAVGIRRSHSEVNTSENDRLHENNEQQSDIQSHGSTN